MPATGPGCALAERVLRFDRATAIHCDPKRSDGILAELTDEGFLRVPLSNIARSGTLIYGDGQTTWVEYRPDAEIFSAATMKSFELMPITDGHPSVLVTSENAIEFTRGTLGSDVQRREEFLAASMMIRDKALVEKVRKGDSENSIGFLTEVTRQRGVAPDGTRFDAIQRRIIGNHNAIVEQGRAGPKVRPAVDSATEVSIDASHLAAVLQAMLREKGMTQADLAMESGVSESTVGDVCRGETGHPNPGILDAFAKALDVKMTRLLAELPLHEHKDGSMESKQDGKALGDLIRRIMEEKEIPISRLATAAGISASTVGQIIRGEINIPPPNRIEGIARALGVPASRLQATLPTRDTEDDMSDEKKTKVVKLPDGSEMTVAADDAPKIQAAFDVQAKAETQAKTAADAKKKAKDEADVKAKAAAGPESENDKLKGRIDVLEEGRKADAKANLETFDSRLELVSKAREICGDSYVHAGKSETQIRRDVIKAIDEPSDKRCEGKSEAFVEGTYEASLDRHEEQSDTSGEAMRAGFDAYAGDDEDSLDKLFDTYHEDQANAWKQRPGEGERASN